MGPMMSTWTWVKWKLMGTSSVEDEDEKPWHVGRRQSTTSYWYTHTFRKTSLDVALDPQLGCIMWLPIGVDPNHLQEQKFWFSYAEISPKSSCVWKSVRLSPRAASLLDNAPELYGDIPPVQRTHKAPWTWNRTSSWQHHCSFQQDTPNQWPTWQGIWGCSSVNCFICHHSGRLQRPMSPEFHCMKGWHMLLNILYQNRVLESTYSWI